MTGRVLTGLGAGFLFGLGLVVSGMGDPAKVLNFLDIAGTWDASLAIVMGAAVIVTFIGYRIVLAIPKPVFEPQFHLPTKVSVDSRLLGGAALFGIGWGLSGLCPGPAFTVVPQGLVTGSTPFLAFFTMMLAGMWVARAFHRQKRERIAA